MVTYHILQHSRANIYMRLYPQNPQILQKLGILDVHFFRQDVMCDASYVCFVRIILVYEMGRGVSDGRKCNLLCIMYTRAHGDCLVRTCYVSYTYYKRWGVGRRSCVRCTSATYYL